MDEIVQLLRQAKGLLDRAERLTYQRMQSEAAGAGEGLGGFDDPESPASWLRFYRFLRAVEKEGPRGIDADRQRELLLAVGYGDARAGGGFFNGVNASLRRDPASDQRYLTESGRRMLQHGVVEFGDAIDDLAPPVTA